LLGLVQSKILDSDSMSERLSACVDGELECSQVRKLLLRMKRDTDARKNWEHYHLIRDVLRGVQGSNLSIDICAQLENEPTVLAPCPHIKAYQVETSSSAGRLKIAALTFFAFVIGMGAQSVQQNFSSIAQTSDSDLNELAVPIDERAKQYLMAHLHYSNSKSMQGAAMYTQDCSRKKNGYPWC